MLINHRYLTLSLSAAALCLSPVTWAGSSHYDYAQVLDVDPVIEQIHRPKSKRDCWNEEVSHHSHDGGATEMIVGGIVGGVVGNQFGEGRGKDAATIAGTLLGGSIGRDVAKNDARTYKSKERHCRVIHESYEEEHITGYRVTYRYHGGIYHTYMDHHPGSRVRVKVSVSLAE